MGKIKFPKVVLKKDKVKKELVEDRSAYNCTACKGEGLDASQQRCSKCSGTGKV